MELVLKEESFQVVGACIEVHRQLGPGFLEAVYQECLALELDERGIPYQREVELSIRYKGRAIEKGYRADFVCFDQILIETKAVKTIDDNHRAQLINYLRATQLPLGLLVNFASHPKLQHERIVLTQR